jgi:hypothetical protein
MSPSVDGVVELKNCVVELAGDEFVADEVLVEVVVKEVVVTAGKVD